MNEDTMMNNSNNQNHKEKKIIEDNIYLLDEVVKEFQNSGEEQEDLIQVGYIGLLNAINLYYNRGEEIFTKKARYLIAGEMRNFIRRKNNKVKIPEWLKMVNDLIDQILVSYHKKFKKLPNFRELSQMLNMTPEGLEETLKAREVVHKVSIDKDRRAKDITESPDTTKIKKLIQKR